MDPDHARIQVREELLLAKQSRLEGNEGRARVCARRAAGAAVNLYLGQLGLISGSVSALNSLKLFAERLDLPPRVQEAVSWLIQRVDLDYSLPAEVDLIQQARIILEYLDEIAPGETGAV